MINRCLLAHDVITSPGELMRHGSVCHRYFSLRRVALIVASFQLLPVLGTDTGGGVMGGQKGVFAACVPDVPVL